MRSGIAPPPAFSNKPEPEGENSKAPTFGPAKPASRSGAVAAIRPPMANAESLHREFNPGDYGKLAGCLKNSA